MYLYIKFQAILNYLRTGELHLPSFICGPAAREELLVIPLDVFITITNVLKELTRVVFDSGKNNFLYKQSFIGNYMYLLHKLFVHVSYL